MDAGVAEAIIVIMDSSLATDAVGSPGTTDIQLVMVAAAVLELFLVTPAQARLPLQRYPKSRVRTRAKFRPPYWVPSSTPQNTHFPCSLALNRTHIS